MSYSVIIPTYNCRLTIGRCVASVFDQTMRPEKVFIVDDCSTDGTFDEIKELARRFPLEIMRNQKNLGAGLTRKMMISQVTSEFVAFLDADDFWDNNHIQILSQNIQEFASDIATSGARLYNKTGDYVGKRCPAIGFINHGQLLTENLLITSGTMLKRTVTGYKNFPEIRRRQDYAYWLYLIRTNPDLVISATGKCTVNYSRSGASLSSNKVYNFYYNYLVFKLYYRTNFLKSVYYTLLTALNRIRAE